MGPIEYKASTNSVDISALRVYAESAQQAYDLTGLGEHGVTVNAVLAPIANEYAARLSSGLEFGVQLSADVRSISDAFLSNAGQYRSEWDRWAENPTVREDAGIGTKLRNPILIDVGDGNIQTFTAIGLIDRYVADNPNGDPLNLKPFSHDPQRIPAALNEHGGWLTVAISALMVKEGAQWFESHSANWSDLSQEEREALLVAYYKRGEWSLNERYEKYISTVLVGEFTSHPYNTPSAVEYQRNYSAVSALTDPFVVSLTYTDTGGNHLVHERRERENGSVLDTYKEVDPKSGETGFKKEVTTSSSGNTVKTVYTVKDDDRPHVQDAPNVRGHGTQAPILLDLTGDGIQITELSTSQQFFDAGNDGLKNRIAWAAAGNAVLFYDPDNTGEITETRQFIFTEWDPTATSDLEALASVFDTNGEAKLNVSLVDALLKERGAVRTTTHHLESTKK